MTIHPVNGKPITMIDYDTERFRVVAKRTPFMLAEKTYIAHLMSSDGHVFATVFEANKRMH